MMKKACCFLQRGTKLPLIRYILPYGTHINRPNMLQPPINIRKFTPLLQNIEIITGRSNDLKEKNVSNNRSKSNETKKLIEFIEKNEGLRREYKEQFKLSPNPMRVSNEELGRIEDMLIDYLETHRFSILFHLGSLLQITNKIEYLKNTGKIFGVVEKLILLEITSKREYFHSHPKYAIKLFSLAANSCYNPNNTKLITFQPQIWDFMKAFFIKYSDYATQLDYFCFLNGLFFCEVESSAFYISMLPIFRNIMLTDTVNSPLLARITTCYGITHKYQDPEFWDLVIACVATNIIFIKLRDFADISQSLGVIGRLNSQFLDISKRYLSEATLQINFRDLAYLISIFTHHSVDSDSLWMILSNLFIRYYHKVKNRGRGQMSTGNYITLLYSFGRRNILTSNPEILEICTEYFIQNFRNILSVWEHTIICLMAFKNQMNDPSLFNIFLLTISEQLKYSIKMESETSPNNCRLSIYDLSIIVNQISKIEDAEVIHDLFELVMRYIGIGDYEIFEGKWRKEDVYYMIQGLNRANWLFRDAGVLARLKGCLNKYRNQFNETELATLDKIIK